MNVNGLHKFDECFVGAGWFVVWVTFVNYQELGFESCELWWTFMVNVIDWIYSQDVTASHLIISNRRTRISTQKSFKFPHETPRDITTKPPPPLSSLIDICCKKFLFLLQHFECEFICFTSHTHSMYRHHSDRGCGATFRIYKVAQRSSKVSVRVQTCIPVSLITSLHCRHNRLTSLVCAESKVRWRLDDENKQKLKKCVE